MVMGEGLTQANQIELASKFGLRVGYLGRGFAGVAMLRARNFKMLIKEDWPEGSEVEETQV